MLNAAIVGLGWWGRTILRTMAQSKELQITLATDIDPAMVSVEAEFSVRFVADIDDILADPAIQVVILCTPHAMHAKQIPLVAEAGKHVFCEKPLCLTRADAVQAVAACRARSVLLGVGHERRFEPPIIALRRMVEAGTLGTLLQIEANFSQDKFLALPADNWRLSPTVSPAGPMTATAIHVLDLSISFLGPAKRVLVNVKQLASHMTNGDTLAMMIEFESGANALISAVLATPFDGRFAVYGSTGWAEVRDKAHPETPEGWTLTRVLREGGRSVTEYPPVSSVRANLEAFAAAIVGRAPYPMPDQQKIATVATLEAAFRSAASGAVEMV
jgi:predicted dehydrogenase